MHAAKAWVTQGAQPEAVCRSREAGAEAPEDGALCPHGP